MPSEKGVASRFAWIGTIISMVIFILSIVVLWEITKEIKWEDLKKAFVSASVQQINLAILFTVISYLCLTFYDFFALKQLKLKVGILTSGFASFTSYAISFTLGFPLLTAGTVRYWIYKPKGLKTSQIATLTVIAGITFWLGMGLVLGWSLLREADSLSRLVPSHANINRMIGAAALIFIAGYLIWVSMKRRSVTVKGWRLELPGFRLSLGQILIGAGDVCAGAAVLYVLLPEGHNMSFVTFLAIYVFASMVGMASHVPGAAGVLEATMLVALSWLPREQVLGALLMFRIAYYLVPFLVALMMLGAYEIARRLKETQRNLTPDHDQVSP